MKASDFIQLLGQMILEYGDQDMLMLGYAPGELQTIRGVLATGTDGGHHCFTICDNGAFLKVSENPEKFIDSLYPATADTTVN